MVFSYNMLEKSSFRLVFGESPIIKVLDFLIDNQEFDYSLTDIAKGAEIAWSTLHDFWPDFVRLSLVKKTRQIGRAELYKLNTENPVVQKLVELDLFISQQLIMPQLEKEPILA